MPDDVEMLMLKAEALVHLHQPLEAAQSLNRYRNSKLYNPTFIIRKPILGDPGSTSRDEVILSGKRYFRRESLLQELKSPWELILTEPVPEVVDHFAVFLCKTLFSLSCLFTQRRINYSIIMKWVLQTQANLTISLFRG